MEYFTPEKTKEGLKIHITSTSPFVIAWKQIEDNNTSLPTSVDDGSSKNEESASISTPSTKDNMAVRMMFVMCFMISAGLVIIYTLQNKKCNEK